MERKGRNGEFGIPSIFDQINPPELKPGQPEYTHYLENEVAGTLELLTRSIDEVDLSEKFSYYLIEEMQLRQMSPDQITTGIRLRIDVLDAVFNFIGNEAQVTKQSVSEAYAECLSFIEKQRLARQSL